MIRIMRVRVIRVVLALMLVIVLASGCAEIKEPGGTTAGNDNAQGTTYGISEGTTSDAELRTYQNKPLEGVHPSKQKEQTFGAEGSNLEEVIRTHMGFAKAEPGKENFVFTVDLTDSGFEPYDDGQGSEVKPMEQFFFPFLNDNSAEAIRFNDGIADKISVYNEALEFHKAEATGVRLGFTYKTFFYKGYLSIVMLEWLEHRGVGYVIPYTVVYDLVRHKFLSKRQIAQDLNFDIAEMTSAVDSWYAEGDKRVLDGYNHRRDMATALLEIWTDAYDLFEGTRWKADYLRRQELARTHSYAREEALEFHAPYFIDDEGHFCMIKTTLVSGGANEEGLLPGSCYVPQYTSAFRQSLRSDNHNRPILGFEQLAKLTKTEGQDIDAYFVRIGENIHDVQAKKMLEGLNAQEGLSALGMDLFSAWEDGGVLDLYVIVPKYENAVVGVQLLEINDATEWQNFRHTIGYTMIVLDKRKSEIHIVHRGRHGVLSCEEGEVKVINDGAKIFDATEWIEPKGEVSPEVNEIIELFVPKG